MNGRTAKALRKALGFHPADEREYTGKHTVKATGPRSQYQAVKRNPALVKAVLRGASHA